MMQDSFKKGFLLYFGSVFFATVIVWLNIVQYPIFNSDGLLYLYTAQVFQQSGLHAAMSVYNWPFYSILIAKTASFLHWSLLETAYLYTTVWFSGLTLVFIQLTSKLGGSYRLQWLALLVILFYRPLNKYSYFIIRDQGYWFFLLLSLLLLIQFFEKPSWIRGLVWSCSLVLAALFRVEAFFFLVLIPMSAFFVSSGWKNRVFNFLKLNSLSFIGVVFLFYFLIVHSVNLFHLGRLNDLLLVVTQGAQSVIVNFHHYAQLLNNIFPPPSRHDGLGFLLIGVVFYSFTILISTMTLAYSILIGFAYRFFKSQNRNIVYAISFYLLISLLIVFGFTAGRLYFVGRYYISVTLFLLILVPFGLREFYRISLRKKNVITVGLSIFLIGYFCFMAAGTLVHFGNQKTYLQDVVKWTARNTMKEQIIYTNIGHLEFLSKRKTFGWQAKHDTYINDIVFSSSGTKGVGQTGLKMALDLSDYVIVLKKMNQPYNSFALMMILSQFKQEKFFENKRDHVEIIIYKRYISKTPG